MSSYFLKRAMAPSWRLLAAAATVSSFSLLPAPPKYQLRTALRIQHSYCEPKKTDYESYYYERMNMPTRAQASSHIIFGQLLQPNLLERYHIYKRIPESSSEVVVADIQLGTKLDGHVGVVHGGIIALLLDDVMGFAYEALKVPKAVTANLNVNFRSPVPSGAAILIKIHLVKKEGRKLYFDAKVVNPKDESMLYAEATSLYIVPREHYKEQEDHAAAA